MHAHITDALMRVAERPPQVFVPAPVPGLHDQAGKRYLDFVQGWATNCLGHAPPELAQALGAQAQRLRQLPAAAFFNEPAARLAQLIAAHSCFDQVFFCNSGAEANEGAIKLARKWGASIAAGRSRSSPSTTLSTAARSPPCRLRASRSGTVCSSPGLRGFPRRRSAIWVRSQA